MSGADDLFSSEAPPPIPDRLGRARLLLVLAAPLVFLGPACFTGVPGALIALFAWFVADEELSRVERGALPAERAPGARRLRTAAFGLLVASAGLLTLTIGLFATGAYDLVAQVAVEAWNGGGVP